MGEIVNFPKAPNPTETYLDDLWVFENEYLGIAIEGPDLDREIVMMSLADLLDAFKRGDV